MHRQDWIRVLRVLGGVVLAGAIVISVRTYLGQTLTAAIPSNLFLMAAEAPHVKAAPKEPSALKTAYPGQVTWAWVSSEYHEGSSEVLAGTRCTKCHDDSAAKEALWPTWSAPPSDHKQALGCQTCHGIVPQTPTAAGSKAGSREPR